MLVSSMESKFPAGSITDMLYFYVCSTGVVDELMNDDFGKLSLMLVHVTATCLPPLPLATIVVHLLQNFYSVHVSLQKFLNAYVH